MNTEDLYRCDQCEKYFPEDQTTATGGDEIYCKNCWPEKVAETADPEAEEELKYWDRKGDADSWR